MKTKVLALVLALVLVLSIFAGCARQTTPPPATTPPATTPPSTTPPSTTPPAGGGTPNPPDTTPNVTTSASIVNDEAAFKKAISNTGTWIIATLKDMTFTDELVLDGEFKNGKKDAQGKDIIQRKIALYTQDDKRNITGTFSLTAPKLTINSPNAGLWYGTFNGDIYVNAPNFTLFGATINGNVYFTNDNAKNTFKKDETKQPVKITGKTELKK